jgi:hypothetical protein
MDQISKEEAFLALLGNCLIFTGFILHCVASLPDNAFLLSRGALTLVDFLLVSGIAIYLSLVLDAWLLHISKNDQLNQA